MVKQNRKKKRRETEDKQIEFSEKEGDEKRVKWIVRED